MEKIFFDILRLKHYNNNKVIYEKTKYSFLLDKKLDPIKTYYTISNPQKKIEKNKSY